MGNKWRRFEVMLPFQFNDGRDVPPEWLAEAVLDVADHFGAASYKTQKVEGHWRHGHTEALERVPYPLIKEAQLVRAQLAQAIDQEQEQLIDVHVLGDWLRRWAAQVPCDGAEDG
jgi:hypothetical protein